ncbi:MAG TPA: tRNA-binding protein [Planktothrix sp.]|jgi:tRNA-binding protein
MTTPAAPKDQISFAQFDNVDIRVGRIERVEEFPKARKPAYKLWINFGEIGVKQSSAQITNYNKDDLVGRLIVAVVNFAPRQVADFRSEVLVLGAADSSGAIILLDINAAVPPGAAIC